MTRIQRYRRVAFVMTAVVFTSSLSFGPARHAQVELVETRGMSLGFGLYAAQR